VAALLRVLGATAPGGGRAVAVAAVEGSVPRATCEERGSAAAGGRGGLRRGGAGGGAARGAGRGGAGEGCSGAGRAGARAPGGRGGRGAARLGTRGFLLGGGAGTPIISAPVPRRSHHVLRNSRALDAAAVGGRAGAGLRRRRAL